MFVILAVQPELAQATRKLPQYSFCLQLSHAFLNQRVLGLISALQACRVEAWVYCTRQVYPCKNILSKHRASRNCIPKKAVYGAKEQFFSTTRLLFSSFGYAAACRVTWRRRYVATQLYGYMATRLWLCGRVATDPRSVFEWTDILKWSQPLKLK